jgi:5S rRNA maturation endonuclease (ribonuclease M5)
MRPDFTHLQNFVDFLNNECELGSLVVVEGKKDLKALRSIGFGEDLVVYNNFR